MYWEGPPFDEDRTVRIAGRSAHHADDLGVCERGRGRGRVIIRTPCRAGPAHSGSVWQVLLTRSCLARIPDGMCSSALVQDLRCEVRSVGPGDGADLGVNAHVCEERRIAERGEHALPLTEMGQIDIACQAVREREPQPVVAEDFDVTDVVKRRDHKGDSTPAAESGRAADGQRPAPSLRVAPPDGALPTRTLAPVRVVAACLPAR